MTLKYLRQLGNKRAKANVSSHNIGSLWRHINAGNRIITGLTREEYGGEISEEILATETNIDVLQYNTGEKKAFLSFCEEPALGNNAKEIIRNNCKDDFVVVGLDKDEERKRYVFTFRRAT